MEMRDKAVDMANDTRSRAQDVIDTARSKVQDTVKSVNKGGSAMKNGGMDEVTELKRELEIEEDINNPNYNV
jgi:hypothetical protein